jgi:hypothetical protein
MEESIAELLKINCLEIIFTTADKTNCYGTTNLYERDTIAII